MRRESLMSVRQVGSSASWVDVLKGMTIEDRRRLARIATKRRFRAGEFLYSQGDAAQHFYIVESGRIRIFYQTPAGREPTVTHRGPGDLFGISMVLIDGQVRIGRSRNTPPAARAAEVVKGHGPAAGGH